MASLIDTWVSRCLHSSHSIATNLLDISPLADLLDVLVQVNFLRLIFFSDLVLVEEVAWFGRFTGLILIHCFLEGVRGDVTSRRTSRIEVALDLDALIRTIVEDL